MADESPSPENAEAPKKKSPLLLFIVVGVLMALEAVAVFAVMTVTGGGAASVDAAEIEGEVADEDIISEVELIEDQFQNVSTDSISAILSEARKYKLGLTVAHQFIAQLDEKIRDSVFGNVGSMACFRVGPEDARYLEHQFAPEFSEGDLMNIQNWNAYMRVLSNGTPTKPFSMQTIPPSESDPMRAAQLIEESYQKYGRPRDEIEREIQERYKKEAPPSVPSAQGPLRDTLQ